MKLIVGMHFQYKVVVFFKEIILDGPLEKIKDYAIRVEFQEPFLVAHMFIHSNRFLTHQILKMKLST